MAASPKCDKQTNQLCHYGHHGPVVIFNSMILYSIISFQQILHLKMVKNSVGLNEASHDEQPHLGIPSCL